MEIIIDAETVPAVSILPASTTDFVRSVVRRQLSNEKPDEGQKEGSKTEKCQLGQLEVGADPFDRRAPFSPPAPTPPTIPIQYSFPYEKRRPPFSVPIETSSQTRARDDNPSRRPSDSILVDYRTSIKINTPIFQIRITTNIFLQSNASSTASRFVSAVNQLFPFD